VLLPKTDEKAQDRPSLRLAESAVNAALEQPGKKQAIFWRKFLPATVGRSGQENGESGGFQRLSDRMEKGGSWVGPRKENDFKAAIPPPYNGHEGYEVDPAHRPTGRK
jgi:hypothetical protein